MKESEGLPARRSPLAMDAAAFRAAGHDLVEQIAQLLESVPSGPVTRAPSPSEVRDALALDAPLPSAGADPAALLQGLAARIGAQSLFNGHPRFFGYVTAPPSPIGILGDFLASALNPNVGAWTLSPAASEIEGQTVRWIAELIGYPADAGGLLVSGGNMANFVGFLAARRARAPWDVRTRGAAGDANRSLVAYASSETHTWIQKAADLFGIGTDAVRWIPTDHDLRMDTGALMAQIDADRAAGHIPFIVVGTAGSVSTGAVDPLRAIAAICRERDIWFHVDGAYGGFAAAAASAPDDLKALRLADSVAIDPHKWLYAPLEAGCALVRDRRALTDTFSYHPAYYHFDETRTNYVDFGPQNSRGFRALKVWLGLRMAGGDGYRQMIEDDMALSRSMAAAVDREPELQRVTQDLSITTFRFVPADLAERSGDETVSRYLNRLNEALLEDVQAGGEVFVSNAVVRGMYLLRACIVNFHTSGADVAATPAIIARRGRIVDAGLRSSMSMPNAM